MEIYFSTVHLLDPDYLPRSVNSGWLLTGYTIDRLRERLAAERIVLPICSLETGAEALRELGGLVLPPLYHEALDADLKEAVMKRIHECFPFFLGTKDREISSATLEVVELPRCAPQKAQAEIACFSVDTAVEEHGPHLPLMTDTLQSYAVLKHLAKSDDSLTILPPVEYGHLTWGLPFGLSIDLTPPLVTRYVAGFMNAVLEWCSPKAIYVVDVHGSIVHRNAIQAGMKKSRCEVSGFRWLHDPLVEFAGDRGDQHAGAMETANIERINPALVDSDWWPDKASELIEKQMSLDTAISLSADLNQFIAHVEANESNGIVGAIENYDSLNADVMFERMFAVAKADVEELKRSVRSD